MGSRSSDARKLKLQVLQIYNSKLDEREKRKQFIISRKLWDYKKAYNTETNLPRDEQDLVSRMRLFERFHTQSEHKVFLEDILKAKRLRKEISKLQMYPRMGMKSLAEAKKYELNKQRRMFHKRQLQQQQQAKDDGSKRISLPATEPPERGAETTSMSLLKQYRTGERRNRKSINRGVTPPTGETVRGSENATTNGSKASEEPSGKEVVRDSPMQNTAQAPPHFRIHHMFTQADPNKPNVSTEQRYPQELPTTCFHIYPDINVVKINVTTTEGTMEFSLLPSHKLTRFVCHNRHPSRQQQQLYGCTSHVPYYSRRQQHVCCSSYDNLWTRTLM